MHYTKYNETEGSTGFRDPKPKAVVSQVQ